MRTVRLHAPLAAMALRHGWSATIAILAVACGNEVTNGDASPAQGAVAVEETALVGDETRAGGDDASQDDAGSVGADGAGAGDGAASGLGVACQTDKACVAYGLVCDKAAQWCVACNGDEDCEGDAACKAHACVPPARACKSSKDCAASGQVCDKTANACVDCLFAEDCPSSKVCVENVCVAMACTPGAVACKGPATLMICAADGLAWADSPCPPAQVCDAGACKAQVCAPGAVVCQGGALVICNADGLGYGVAKACPAGQQCTAGACVDKACSPGKTQCASLQELLTCDGAGGSWLASTCPAGKACLTNATGSGCTEVDCLPGAKVCLGDTLRSCTSTGAVGELEDDCGKKGQVCHEGACAPPPCVDVDKDGAGAGSGCAKGADCDDSNPNFQATCPSCAEAEEGCPCSGGTAPCYPGPAGEAGVGLCKVGERACAAGYWTACLGAIAAKPEACDGDDNDCDGATDDGVLNLCGTCDPSCTGVAIGPAAGGGPLTLGAGSAGVAVDGKGQVVVDVQKGLAPDNLWIANSGEQTLSRISTSAGVEVARYKSCGSPSRTAVDLVGDAWVGCRTGGGIMKLAGSLSHCIDKNGNGTIDTSSDLNGDKVIAANEVLPFGTDECVLILTVPVAGEGTIRAAAVTKGNDVWVGGWNTMGLYKLDGATAAVTAKIDIGCNPYGLAIDSKGTLWAQCPGAGLIRADATSLQYTKFTYPAGAYGIAVDAFGDVWVASGGNASRFAVASSTWKVVQLGASGGRGVCADKTGRVFVAADSASQIAVVNAATLTKEAMISLGAGRFPVGVAVDFSGFVWAVNQGKATTSKVDPATMNVVAEIPVGAGPYTYSDMTGYALHTFGAAKGVFMTVLDGSAAQKAAKPGAKVRWQSVAIVGQLPGASAISWRVRAADNQAALAAATWSTTYGPIPPAPKQQAWSVGQGPVGAWLQVEVTMQADADKNSPVLQGISAIAAAE